MRYLYLHTHKHTHIYIYICIYVYISNIYNIHIYVAWNPGEDKTALQKRRTGLFASPCHRGLPQNLDGSWSDSADDVSNTLNTIVYMNVNVFNICYEYCKWRIYHRTYISIRQINISRHIELLERAMEINRWAPKWAKPHVTVLEIVILRKCLVIWQRDRWQHSRWHGKLQRKCNLIHFGPESRNTKEQSWMVWDFDFLGGFGATLIFNWMI